MKRYLWVVETQNRNKKWLITSDGFILRKTAIAWRDKYWKDRFPNDKFRVVKYTPAE